MGSAVNDALKRDKDQIYGCASNLIYLYGQQSSLPPFLDFKEIKNQKSKLEITLVTLVCN